MRRKLAIGILSLMVVLGSAFVGWAGDGAAQGPDPGQGQHQWAAGQHRFADGGPGRFGEQGRWGGREAGRRMGWQRGGHRGFGGGDHLLRMAENPRVRQYLGLTDDQVTRLHEIGINAEKSAVQTRADLELRHIELRELLRADNPDHDAIMNKLDQINALQGKMEKQRVETMLSARAVMTPEQLKKIKTFMENRGSGMEHGPMMHRHAGPGGWGPGHPGGGAGGSAPKPQPAPAQ